MDNDENKLKKRFAELSLRAVEQRRTVSSDFLTLDEQSTLASAQLFSRVYLYGGYPLAERRAALFGEKSEEEKSRMRFCVGENFTGGKKVCRRAHSP